MASPLKGFQGPCLERWYWDGMETIGIKYLMYNNGKDQRKEIY